MNAAANRSHVVPGHRYGSRRRKRRTVTLSVLFIILVAAGVLLFAPRTLFGASTREAPQVVSHKVVQGDTLWDLATRYGGEGDIRTTVEAIQETNHLRTANIEPGQVLLIPVLGR